MNHITTELVNAWEDYIRINLTNHTRNWTRLELEPFCDQIYRKFQQSLTAYDFSDWYEKELKAAGRWNPKYIFTFTMQKKKSVTIQAADKNTAYQLAVQEAAEDGMEIIAYTEEEAL